MGTLTLSLFGNFQAVYDGEPVGTFRTNKAQALLIYLAVEHDKPHRREHLMTLLWPDMPLSSAQVNLRQVLYRLRQMFPDLELLLADRATAQLNPNAAIEVDLHRFDALLTETKHHAHASLVDCPTCRRALEEAVGLTRGDFLADFYLEDSNAFEEWAERTRENLRRSLMAALHTLAEAALETGNYPQAQRCAWKQLENDPLSERAYRQLMAALAYGGQRNAALTQYQICKQTLEDELDATPSQETTDLYEHIRTKDLSTEPHQRSFLPPEPTNLPVGTVIFLFTDIQSSTPLWESQPGKMADALEIHNAALRQAIEIQGGIVFKTVGDSFQAAFPTAPQALDAAIQGQRNLREASWNELGELKVRMGLHTGEAQLDPGGDEYEVSHTKNRVARIMSAAYGGQILLSRETKELVDHQLPEGVRLKDLGKHRMKGMSRLEHLYQVVVPDLPSEFPRLGTMDIAPNNLPVQPTPFIGREQELAELDRLLTDPDTRLVTIVGPGGMGKTRLALAAAERQLTGRGELAIRPTFPDGVFFVDLAPLNEARQIPLAVAEALDIQLSDEAGGAQQQLLDYFQNRTMLLILDNFEHLMDGVPFAHAILSQAPNIKIIATSRQRLSLRGEQIFKVPGLDFPDRVAPEDAAGYSAAQVFLGAARRMRADFELAEADLPHLTHLCQLVGGMPLALELAAGWVELLSLEEIAHEIKGGLDLLETDQWGVPERQRSMQAVFDYTWNRLEPSEQALLATLSVFRGGFTRQAAVAVSLQNFPAVLKLLGRLASKSLVQSDPARGRYHFHELLRQYAKERLEQVGGLEEALEAHAVYFFSRLPDWEKEIKNGERQLEALLEIEAELANIRAAWDWALENRRFDWIDRSLDGLYWFCRIRARHLEGVELFERAEKRLDTSEDRFNHRAWRRLAVRRITLDGSAWARAYRDKKHDMDGIFNAVREDKTEPPGELAFILEIYSFFLGEEDDMPMDLSGSLSLFERAQRLYQQADDRFSEYWLVGVISWYRYRLFGLEKRVEGLKKQLEMALENHDRLVAADARGGLGYVEEMAGNFNKAEAAYRQVLPVFQQFGDRHHILEYHYHLAEIAFLKGEIDEAREWIEKALAISDRLPKGLDNFFRGWYRGTQGKILNVEERYNDSLKMLKMNLTMDLEFVGFFPVQRSLTYAYCGLRDFSRAREIWVLNPHAFPLLDAPGWQVQMLPAAALIAASEDRLEYAAELLSLAYHHPAAATGWQDKFPLIIRLRERLEKELPEKTLAKARERGKTLDLAETVSVLIEEFNRFASNKKENKP